MPVPQPESGEDEQTFVSRCIDEMHKIDPKREDKQIQAICFSQWRDRKRIAMSEPIPILRSFESDGKKYIAGYAAIFDSEDSYGTAMTREAAEGSRARLQSFPAVRFMHRIPFGQIDFENEVEFEGEVYKTFIDDHGFHVLCRVYDQCENEWNMVRSGKWGFSYGFQPDAQGGVEMRKLANGHMVPAFVKGIIYEVSVVDTPSHSDATAYVVSRIIHGDTGENITKGANNMPDDKDKKEEKDEFEQRFKDAETRIIKSVTEALERKSSTVSADKAIKDMEERIMAAVNKKLADQAPEKTKVQQTFEGVNRKIEDMNTKIASLKEISRSLTVSGEDNKALSERIAGLEKQRDDLAKSITESVEKTVTRMLGDVKSRLSAIEEIPEFRSPASLGESSGVVRGMGFGNMLEASQRGTQ